MDFFWWVLKIACPHQLEETLTWKFNQLGINRIAFVKSPSEVSELIFYAWLPSNEWPEENRNNLITLITPLAATFGFALEKPHWEKVSENDWSSSWKQHWQPDPVGNNLLILPNWMEIPKRFIAKKIIRLDPGSAFGTGSHPTTRLCLEALEKLKPINLRVADLGCGSGILGITALALGAENVFCVDIDPLSVSAASHNFLINRASENQFFVENGSLDKLFLMLNSEPVDLLICNILASVIEKFVPDLHRLVNHDSTILLSGLLVDQVLNLEKSLNSYNWRVVNMVSKDGWALLEIKR